MMSEQHGEVGVRRLHMSADFGDKVVQVGKLTSPQANFKGAPKRAFGLSTSHSAAS